MELKQRAYCLQCNAKTAYTIRSQRVEMTVRGITFGYTEESAYCVECGEMVYVPEVNDRNVKSREDAYRRAAHLITIPELQQILQKYNIGAGPLAKVMGFGEITINRYLAGQLPAKEHSDKLLRILASHTEMEKRLEDNRERITPIAYEKCRNALDALRKLYSNGKIELVTRYILQKTVEITPLALQKLLYFAQAFFYALYHEPLFTDDCQAWAYGPVYPEVYKRYKDYGYNPIESWLPEKSDFSELSDREICLLDAIVDSFGKYSGWVLRDITHMEQPWIEARGSLLPADHAVTVISRDTINTYFREIVCKYQITSPCDIHKYCSAMVERLL